MEENQTPQQPARKPDISMKVTRLPETEHKVTEVREIKPVVFFDRLEEDAEENLFDFRPEVDVEEVAEDEVVSTPKVSSAPEPVESSDSTPPSTPETPAPVEKDSGQPKESESGRQTS